MAPTASANVSPVWPGPSLLVPMTVDCLLVGHPDQQSTWAYTATNYLNLALGVLPDVAPPLTPNPNPPGAGAHLMWTLPYALRHGSQQQSGQGAGTITFPNAPNRWLVLRIQYGAPGDTPTLSAGVIQSDLLSPMTANTISQYPDPDNPDNAVQIGGYVPIQQWTSPAGPASPFLQAIGPGTLSWAVAYDNIRDVFSVYDALPTPSAPLTYTYSVIGWYAAPPADPMYVMPTDSADAWRTKAGSAFNWAVGETIADVQSAQSAWSAWQTAHGLDGAVDPSLPPQLREAIQQWVTWQTANGVTGQKPPLPQQMLVHGMVANVIWSGPSTAYGSGAPNDGGTSFPAVSVGNTAVEAIGRWIAEVVVARTQGSPAAIPVIERAVDAFQKGLLNQLQSDPVGVERLLHKARFTAGFSGKVWIVVRPESDGSNPSDFTGQQSIPLTAADSATLTTLNGMQSQQNDNVARLFSQQLELFALEYKSANLPRNASQALRTQVATALSVMQTEVGTLQSTITTLGNSINSLSHQFATTLGQMFELRLVDEPTTFAPNDPVIMVANAHADTKLAPPGEYDDDDALATRFTGQMVTGIEIDYADGLPSDPLLIGPAELLGSVTLPTGLGIPKEIPDLWLETLFLDTSNAGLLAALYFQKRGVTPPAGALAALTTTIQGQQTAPWNNGAALGVTSRALGAALGLQGVVPSKVAVEFRAGQPWTPVFMDWKVLWYPTSMDQSASQFTNWTLGDIDYEWTGTTVPPPPSPLVFQGRTVLNVKIAQDIAKQLEGFQDDPDYAALDIYIRQDLEEVARVIGTFDVMTQSIGGFTEQLVTRMIAPNQQPQGSLLGDAPVSYRPVAGDVTSVAPLPFFPIRSGHFLLVDLWIVDSYGQILRGKDPRLGPSAPIPNLIIAESLITPGAGNTPYVQLPPRVSQEARATFTLLDARDDSIPSSSSDLTTPICGWVMANHLDQSLMVFDAGGNNQGALLLVDRDVTGKNPTSTAIRWDAVPGSYDPLGAAPSLPNAPHVESLVTGLLAVGLEQGGQALLDLFNVVDSSLWAIEPQSGTGNLSILVGRPLAVVRAQLSLDLYGLPDYNQSWAETGKYFVSGGKFAPTGPPFTTVPFGIRIGDLGDSTNGVVGYYVNDDYSTLYAVYGASTGTAAIREAARTGASIRKALAAAPGPAPSADSGYVTWNHLVMLPPDSSCVTLTILVDPRGTIPVMTGSLPVVSTSLAPGPVTAALANMEVSFRVGPILVEPSAIRMPIPAEINGKWAWVARTDVTAWADPSAIQQQNAVATLNTAPPRLREGWLTLSGAISDVKPH